MTIDDDGGRPRVERAFYERLVAETPRLAVLATARLAEELPLYRRLPAEELQGDVRQVFENGIRAFTDLLGGRPSPDSGRLARIRASAAKRAQEGIPIEAVTSAYHVGAQACIDAMSPFATPADMAAVHRTLLEYLRIALSEVAAGYVEERQALVGESGAARDSLLAALLGGTEIDATAQRVGVTLPQSYVVLSLAIEPHPDEQDPDIDSSIAGRRKLRRLRTELDRLVGQAVLARLSPDGGLVLIPRAAAPNPMTGEGWSWLRRLMDSLMAAAGVSVVAGATCGPPEEVAPLARQATEIRDVARTFSRPGGGYRLDDLLLEFQLTVPSPARRELAALVWSLVDKPDLIPTLRLYLANNLNRRRVAALLHVHANTVDYRMRRVAAITGLDITVHRDLVVLTAALAALDAERASSTMDDQPPSAPGAGDRSG